MVCTVPRERGTPSSNRRYQLVVPEPQQPGRSHHTVSETAGCKHFCYATAFADNHQSMPGQPHTMVPSVRCPSGSLGWCCGAAGVMG